MELTYAETMADGPEGSYYTWIEDHEEYKAALVRAASLTDRHWEVTYTRGILRPTALGRQFYKVVSQPT